MYSALETVGADRYDQLLTSTPDQKHSTGRSAKYDLVGRGEV